MSDETHAYPLRLNESEVARLDAQNVSIKAILGENPVHPALRPALEARIRDGLAIAVLDVATGTGTFARDLIAAYPQASFRFLLTDISDQLLQESAANRGDADPLPPNASFQAWDLHSADVPTTVRNHAPQGFDLINVRFITYVLRVDEWDSFLKCIQSLLSTDNGMLQMAEATHAWAVQDDYELNKSLSPFDRYPYDPVDLARNRGTQNIENIYKIDRLSALHLPSRLKSAGFDASGISTMPFAVPYGKALTPTRPLVTSSRRTTSGGYPGSIPDENLPLAKLEDDADLSSYAALPAPVETDDRKLQQAKENAMVNARSIMSMMSKASPNTGGVYGFRSAEDIARWKEAADAWLEHYAYFHPCAHVAWQRT